VKKTKGVSQVTTAILLLIVTLSSLAYYIMEASNLNEMSITTLSEMYERFSKKISIALQLVDLYVNGSDIVAVLYNYGDEDVHVINVFHPRKSFTIYIYANGELLRTDSIPSKSLALMVFHNASLKDFSPIVLEVENCGIYEISE